MTYDALIPAWCGPSGRTLLITDPVQLPVARAIAAEFPCEIRLYEPCAALQSELAALTPEDLVLVLLSFDSMLTQPRWFTPFSKPEWLRAKCAFFRLNIPEASLREGLSTPKAEVYAMIAVRDALPVGALLHITSPSGTDLTLRTGPFTTCRHEITGPGGQCFLPPSETSSEVLPGSANGLIAVDVTLGQVHRYAEELGHFGLVDAPALITVKDGMLISATGSPMAEAFSALLHTLPADARTLVELGQGLSRMRPTGLIGVDESILTTCHFGFGHHAAGTHTDVVVSHPVITVKEAP